MIGQLVVLTVLLRTLEPLDDPAVRTMCWSLLSKARLGFANDEQAAFVVRNSAGEVSFVEWPPSGEANSARWEGAYPPGTIAIVHTHPNWLPMPSRIDVSAASRVHVPIYVITRTRITKTDGAQPRVVADGDWNPGA
jgi:hypothetical protein